jgi:hypothetical protein
MKELEWIKNMFGVEVEIPKVSGISPYIKSQGRLKYVNIAYSSKMGFYLNTSGVWIGAEDAKIFSDNLIKCIDIINKLNSIYPEK